MKALFFDIDGTLIDIKSHTIPASTVMALREAKARGNKIFIATGRSHTIVDLPGVPKELIDGYVTLNGAICIADDTPVSLSKIPSTTVKALTDVCITNDFTCLYITLHGMKVANGDERFITGFQQYFNLAPVPTTDFSSMLHEDIYQMTVFLTEDAEEKLKPAFPGLEFNRWFPTFADVTAKGVDKAMGIAAISKHFGIDLSDTIAFGDGGNDIPMLKAAGLGVAMGNATDDVKAIADYVTTPVSNDGIYKALKALAII